MESRGKDEPSIEERTEAALAYAISGDWKHAVTENQAIVDADPANTEAANRLGKAYIELRKPRKAEEAYQLALDRDPSNSIALKNLERLVAARKTGARGAKAARPAKQSSKGTSDIETISPTSMIEATSTAREFHLERPELDELAKLDIGDGARLEETERGVAVRSLTGALLGQVEPRTGLRLRRLMEGGNRYAVIIREITLDGAVVYIKETHRDPSQFDQTSFLPPPPQARRKKAPRAYTRRSAVIDADPAAVVDDDAEPDEWDDPVDRPKDDLDGTGFTEAGEEAEQDLDDDDDDLEEG